MHVTVSFGLFVSRSPFPSFVSVYCSSYISLFSFSPMVCLLQRLSTSQFDDTSQLKYSCLKGEQKFFYPIRSEWSGNDFAHMAQKALKVLSDRKEVEQGYDTQINLSLCRNCLTPSGVICNSLTNESLWQLQVSIMA